MRLPTFARLFGMALFIGMMATGYYYNVTFIQLGLLDLGGRVLGMDAAAVARDLGLLALLTSAVSLLVGFALVRSGRSSDFRLKLRLACAVVFAQTALSAGTVLVLTPDAFRLWIVLASLALGVGVPVTFGLTVDLVPRRLRGYVAGVIAAIAYFAAPIFSYPWRIETLRTQMLAVMLPGSLAIAALAFIRAPLLTPLIDALAAQHRDPAFYYGRFTRVADGRVRPSRSVLALIALMFAVFFIDSLGFVRLTGATFLVDHAWRSPDVAPRLAISTMHVIAALAGGVLYTALDERSLFLWTLGVFGMAHLAYTFPIRLAPEQSTALLEPLMYAVAVSLYTVLNFALWADLSTPETITGYAALGVAASAWTATFISTAVALQMERVGVPVALHLRIVDALAVLLFFAMLLHTWLARRAPQRNAP